MSVEARERVMALPSLGADMDFGTVVEWRVAPGDALAKGDIVAVVETEKSDIDIETWHAGTVTELLAEVGREIPVGAPLLRMTGDGIEPAPNSLAPAERQVSAEVSTIDSAPDIASVIRPTRRKAVEPPVEPPIDVVAEPAGTGAPTRAALADPVLTDRVLASPRARVAARERGIDLATVTGTVRRAPWSLATSNERAPKPTASNERVPKTPVVGLRFASRADRRPCDVPSLSGWQRRIETSRTTTWKPTSICLQR